MTVPQRWRTHHPATALLLVSMLLPTPQAAVAESDLKALSALQALVEEGRDTVRIEGVFSQEKRFSFLKKPVVSTGRFFFARPSIPDGRPDVLWEYETPARSGLWSSGDTHLVWTRSKQEAHEAKGRESQFLSGMIRQICRWMTPDTGDLTREYDVSFAGDDHRCLKFTAKSGSRTRLFTSLEACPGAGGLLSALSFSEANGDTTVLRFTSVKKNGPKPDFLSR